MFQMFQMFQHHLVPEVKNYQEKVLKIRPDDVKAIPCGEGREGGGWNGKQLYTYCAADIFLSATGFVCAITMRQHRVAFV